MAAVLLCLLLLGHVAPWFPQNRRFGPRFLEPREAPRRAVQRGTEAEGALKSLNPKFIGNLTEASGTWGTPFNPPPFRTLERVHHFCRSTTSTRTSHVSKLAGQDTRESWVFCVTRPREPSTHRLPATRTPRPDFSFAGRCHCNGPAGVRDGGTQMPNFLGPSQESQPLSLLFFSC